MPAEHRPAPIAAAAIAYVALSIGFGVGAIVTLDHLRREGELPMTPWGFRSLSGGPFEALPREQFVALGWALAGLCAVDALTGVGLWQGRRRAAILGLATTPLALGLGIGFALPIFLAGIPLRVALVLAGWRRLR